MSLSQRLQKERRDSRISKVSKKCPITIAAGPKPTYFTMVAGSRIRTDDLLITNRYGKPIEKLFALCAGQPHNR